MNKKKLAFIAMACILCFLSSCDGGRNPSSLVGQWEYVSGATSGKPEDIELFKDGTGVVDKKISISWKVENNRLAMLSSLIGISCDYKISGYELALDYDDGNSAIFVRKGKLEEFKAKQVAAAEAERVKLAAEIAKQALACANKGYKTVKIGSQTWMAENLNCDVSGSVCCNNDEAKCKKYGRLYDWNTAMAVCPKGWHLPNESEWKELYKFIGGANVADKELDRKLKAKSGWNSYEGVSGNGTDDYGFSALPGGEGLSDGSCLYAGYYGYWWSSSEYSSDHAFYLQMICDRNVAKWYNTNKSSLFSVRCVQDKTASQDVNIELPENKESTQNTNPTTPSKYKYPQGSERILTDSDLQNISKHDLRIMRNEIFARHGYIFKSDDLKEYFKNQDWYTPKYEDVNSMLTSIEKKNIEFIKSHE